MSTTCSLQHIFENSLPEKKLESLSWKPIAHSSSFTEIFGELHFNESPQLSPSSSPRVCSSSSSFSDIINHEKNHLVQKKNKEQQQQPLGSTLSDVIIQTPSSLPYISTKSNKNNDSFSSSSLSSAESSNIYTESLGFSETSGEVEKELKKTNDEMNEQQGEEEEKDDSDLHEKLLWRKSRSWSSSSREYPPPISCIGRSGRLSVSFKSFRSNGRFVLKEIRIPTQDFLHAHREDGRLKLHFVQPAAEEEEDEDEDDDFEDEEDYDDVESTDEGEEIHGSLTDQVNKEKRG